MSGKAGRSGGARPGAGHKRSRAMFRVGNVVRVFEIGQDPNDPLLMVVDRIEREDDVLAITFHKLYSMSKVRIEVPL